VSLQERLLQLTPQKLETRTSPQGNQALFQQDSHQDSQQDSQQPHSLLVHLPSLRPRAVQLSREKRTYPQGNPQRNQVVCLLRNHQGNQRCNQVETLQRSLPESPRRNHRRSQQGSLLERPQDSPLHSLLVILLVNRRLCQAGSHL
jgi:hypothetical protein